jgi:hypothetical protein
MQSRFLKVLALAAVVVAIPVAAFAQSSRIAGMGPQGDYIKDYTNIFTYPSCITGVGNLVYGEFGVATDYDQNYSEYFNTEDRAVGAVLGNLFDGRFGTWSFHMREYSPALGFSSQPYILGEGYMDEYLFGTGFETFFQYLDPNVPGETGYTPYWNDYGVEAFDLMWGKKFGTTSVGLRLNRSFYKDEFGSPTVTDEGYAPDDRNVMGFGGGLGFEINPNTSAEFSMLDQSRTFKDEQPGGKFEDDGGTAYLVAGRMMWQWQPNVQVVPVVRFYSIDMSTKFTPTVGAATTNEDKISGWQAGVAGNWQLNQNDLFVAGLTFASNKQELQSTGVDVTFTESLMPTMFAALETHVNPWLTVRFGGRKGVFYTLKVDDAIDPTDNGKVSSSPFIFYMGAGVKLGTLQIDGTLAQDFFHNPATYFTGSPNGMNYYSPLFPKVTATYSF